MKRLLAIILFMCMLTLSACTNANKDTTSSNADEYPVASISVSEDEMLFTETYDRLSNTIANVSYDYLCMNFKEAYNKSDITAKVKIIAFVTNELNDYYTVFLAQILDVYKGNVSKNDKIFILQDGNVRSRMVKDYPIFNISDTFLFNLKVNKYAKVNNQYAFDITDYSCGTIQLYNFKGTEYCINRAMPEYLDDFDLTPVGKSDRSDILKDIYENDSVMEKVSPIYELYEYSDLEEQIRNMIKEK